METIRILTAILVSGSLTSAAPVSSDDLPPGALETRAFVIRNDLIDGDEEDCPQVILVFARGSTEIGNKGMAVGPPLASALENTYEGMWVQWVSGAYTAGIPPNTLPQVTTRGAIDEAKRLFTMAHDKCSDSSGAAVIGGALTQLEDEPDVQDQVAGAVLFGSIMTV